MKKGLTPKEFVLAALNADIIEKQSLGISKLGSKGTPYFIAGDLENYLCEPSSSKDDCEPVVCIKLNNFVGYSSILQKFFKQGDFVKEMTYSMGRLSNPSDRVFTYENDFVQEIDSVMKTRKKNNLPLFIRNVNKELGNWNPQ